MSALASAVSSAPIELIKLQQRVLAMRYMPLPPRSWRLANTVFAVMRTYEATDLPLRTLDTASPVTPGRRREATLEQLYAAIQTDEIPDDAAWPEAAQDMIDAYCMSVDRSIRIHDHNGSSLVAAKDTMLAACRQDAPPAHTLAAQDVGPYFIIDYRTLADSIRLDYVEPSRARSDRNRFAMPPRLAAPEPVHQTTTGYLLYRNLHLPNQWDDLDSSRRRHRDLRIYSGLDEVREAPTAGHAVRNPLAARQRDRVKCCDSQSLSPRYGSLHVCCRFRLGRVCRLSRHHRHRRRQADRLRRCHCRQDRARR